MILLVAHSEELHPVAVARPVVVAIMPACVLQVWQKLTVKYSKSK